MSSYAKQMMEIAADWLKVNPDSGSGFLNVPGLEKIKKIRAVDERDLDVERLKKKLKNPALSLEAKKELQAGIEELDGLMVKMQVATDDLISKEDELVGLINEVPTPSQDKHSRESKLNSDLGRWCLAWGRHGHNVFDLSSDFTAAMLLTDPTAIDIKEAKLPFGGLLVTIPSGFAFGAEGLPYTKIHVWEMAKSHIQQLDIGHQIVDAMKGLSLESKSLVISNVEKSLAAAPSRLLEPTIDETRKAICIYATDGTNVLDTLIEFKDLSWEAIEALPDSVTEDADKQCRRTLQQIIFGMLAYINVTERSVTEHESTKRRKQKGGTESKLKHWEVGRTIKLDQNLVRAARAGSREVALRIKTRFITRGHYRNQAHGPKHSLRTSIWIMPFWKGPENGAEIVHVYQVGDKTKP